jgi:hypothetical protein
VAAAAISGSASGSLEGKSAESESCTAPLGAAGRTGGAGGTAKHGRHHRRLAEGDFPLLARGTSSSQRCRWGSGRV